MVELGSSAAEISRGGDTSLVTVVTVLAQEVDLAVTEKVRGVDLVVIEVRAAVLAAETASVDLVVSVAESAGVVDLSARAILARSAVVTGADSVEIGVETASADPDIETAGKKDDV